MGVDFRNSLAKGWILKFEDFNNIDADIIDKYIDDGYLHYVDSYQDEFPYFLGVYLPNVPGAYSGDVVKLNKIDTNIDEADEEAIINIAKDVFNITDPPSVCLLCRIY